MHIYADTHRIILLRMDQFEPHNFHQFSTEQSIEWSGVYQCYRYDHYDQKH